MFLIHNLCEILLLREVLAVSLQGLYKAAAEFVTNPSTRKLCGVSILTFHILFHPFTYSAHRKQSGEQVWCEM